MQSTNVDLIQQYIQRQILVSRTTMRSRNKNARGQTLHSRHMYIKIQSYVRDYLTDPSRNRRWIIIPGLRGVGKTTLLAQTYLWISGDIGERVNILYVSLDEVVEKLGSNLSQLLDVYEQFLGSTYERLDKKTFIFIDEVQTDPQWARTLKFLYDRTPNIFFICTGSSAVHLQMDADIDGRRAVTEKLFPLSFIEYQLLVNNEYPKKGLKQTLTQALYRSPNAAEVYKRLTALSPTVNQQWTAYDRNTTSQYLQTGTLPFTLAERDIRQVYSAVNAMLEKIISIDLQALKQFKSETIGALKRLIFILSDIDTMPYEAMAQAVGVSKGQIINMLDAFVKAELLIKVSAHGNNVSATTNPSKYLFMSPAIRAALHDIVGLPDTVASRQGMLLEDAAGLHYYREFITKRTGSLTHPYDKEGGQCDFLLRVANDHQIALEFGLGTKDFKQVERTLQKHSAAYGLVFSKTPLGINTDKTVVSVPLDYFYLM